MASWVGLLVAGFPKSGSTAENRSPSRSQETRPPRPAAGRPPGAAAQRGRRPGGRGKRDVPDAQGVRGRGRRRVPAASMHRGLAGSPRCRVLYGK